MPYNLDNNFVNGATESIYIAPTNPTANPGNAETLKTQGDCCSTPFTFVVALEVVSGDLVATITSPSAGLRYIKVTATDGLGNFASTVDTTSPFGPITVTTSGVLNPSQTWQVAITAEEEGETFVTCACMMTVNATISGAEGSTAEIDTTFTPPAL
jgi:hypothetical protein